MNDLYTYYPFKKSIHSLDMAETENVGQGGFGTVIKSFVIGDKENVVAIKCMKIKIE